MTVMGPVEPDATLIIIDVQQGFDDPVWGRRNNLQAEANIARLLAAWRGADRPIIHVQHLSRDPHSPLSAGAPGGAFKEAVRPRDGLAGLPPESECVDGY